MKRPNEIISDEEVKRVHGHANFGTMTPREVLADGVWKYSMGYSGGHTQLCILLEHKLITKPKPGSYKANLTVKGKAYLRSLNPANPADWMGEPEPPNPAREYIWAVVRNLVREAETPPDFIEEMQQ